ncbi:hypothetical protein [Ruminococcus sp.]|uniref:phage tail protein n=1 Tax=Ruminococcus sp. TaxID=41978 RepID=UPI001B5850EF|nr:hypothetical protein [Ruminococcus sp.]MBP5431605.1 phage tail protein [Ruminococcus sp.]
MPVFDVSGSETDYMIPVIVHDDTTGIDKIEFRSTYNNRVGAYRQVEIPQGVGTLNVHTEMAWCDPLDTGDFSPTSLQLYFCYSKGNTIEYLGTMNTTQDTAVDVSRYSGANTLIFFYTRQVAIVSYVVRLRITGTFDYEEWYFDEFNHYNIDSTPYVPPRWQEPYPLWLWQFDQFVDDGDIFHYLLPGVVRREIDLRVLERDHVIRVYDFKEPQNGFEHNGLAILEPISCVSYHDKDRWDVELIHPLDLWGKWKHLLVQNILKIDGQLFRIDIQSPSIGANGRTMKVHARHITCDLADELIVQATFPGGDGQQFLQFCFDNRINPPQIDHDIYQEPYNFSYFSDMPLNQAENELVNASVWGAVVGIDNCMVNTYGGEVYRNNFYFSVCRRMQHAKDNAFNLRYSLDMTEISQTVDYTSFCTNLDCVDNYGNGWSVSYTGEARWAIHHPIRRFVKFNYDTGDGAMERLIHDGYAYWETVNAPKVTYECKIANMLKDPRYAEFLQLQNYEYGDRGRIYCPELDIDTVQQITAVEKNEVTGDYISITLGNLADSLCRPTYMGSTISTGRDASDNAMKAMQEQLDDMKLKTLRNWGAATAYTWAELNKFTWGDVKKYGLYE